MLLEISYLLPDMSYLILEISYLLLYISYLNGGAGGLHPYKSVVSTPYILGLGDADNG